MPARLLLALLLGLLLAPATAAAEVPSVFGGKVACVPSEGVVFCQGTPATRVATFDGVPLDVNVTLPANRTGPVPLVVQLHGYGGSKTGLSASKGWAEKGYAVLNYTARGFNESCGRPQFRTDPVCLERGWIRLADTRFEVRDTQHLAGLLADEGIADPQRIGPTGGSYGGGQSLALALLRDRIWDVADDTIKPWVSPAGKPMRIAAAAPTIPWSDLVYSLVPNGRTLDYTVAGVKDSTSPPGVLKTSFVAGLFASGEASGQYASPGVDPDADLRTWFPRVNAGEPYSDPLAVDILDEISAHHGAYSLPLGPGGAAPLFISNGWTDDLFPVDEALRIVNRLRAESPGTPIRQLHMDYGHQRGQNKAADIALLNRRIREWFDFHLKGDGEAPAQVVEALTQTCPKATASEGPFTAESWGALHPGEVRLIAPEARTLTTAGGDERVSQAVDPIAGGGACATTPATDLAQAATYRFPEAKGDGFTLLGSATVLADVAATGAAPQIASRLWDVGTDGRQTLVARGLYRPEATGRQVFQLHPSGYRFAAGHVAKLELLGRDAPYARASNGAFSVALSNVELRLPVAERPSAPATATGPKVQAPAAPGLPPGATFSRATAAPGAPAPEPVAQTRPRRSGKVSVRTRYTRRSRGRCGGATVRLAGPGLDGARHVDAIARGRRLARDRTGPFGFRLKGAKVRRAAKLSLRITRADGSARTIVRRLRACR